MPVILQTALQIMTFALKVILKVPLATYTKTDKNKFSIFTLGWGGWGFLSGLIFFNVYNLVFFFFYHSEKNTEKKYLWDLLFFE